MIEVIEEHHLGGDCLLLMNPEIEENKIVLVVEDEAFVRMVAINFLEDEGIATFEAGDAGAALEILRQHPEISFLFTDINMPGTIDGVELARLAFEQRPSMRIIITSGKERPCQSELPGDARFVAKPYTAKAVLSLLQAA